MDILIITKAILKKKKTKYKAPLNPNVTFLCEKL